MCGGIDPKGAAVGAALILAAVYAAFEAVMWVLHSLLALATRLVAGV